MVVAPLRLPQLYYIKQTQLLSKLNHKWQNISYFTQNLSSISFYTLHCLSLKFKNANFTKLTTSIIIIIIKHSTYKRIIWYYPSGWAHAPRISYPQSRDTGAACQVASHSKHGEQVKYSSLMCVSFAQMEQPNLSHSPHSNSFSSILIFPSQILQIFV